MGGFLGVPENLDASTLWNQPMCLELITQWVRCLPQHLEILPPPTNGVHND